MQIIEKVSSEILCILKYYDFSLYDMEYIHENGDNYLRVYIEKNDNTPVGIEDCVMLSRKLNAYLEVENPIEEEHILEVSSPGIIKKLRTTEHFEREIGNEIDLILIPKGKNTGILTEVNNEFLIVGGQEIPRIKIKNAYSTYDFGVKND